MAFSLGFGAKKESVQKSGTEELDRLTTVDKAETASTDKLSQLLSEQTQRGTEAATQTGTATGTQTQDVTTLDAATQELLAALTQQIGGVVGEGGLQQTLTERAQTAGEAFDPAPIIARARTGAERDIGRRETALASEAGSSLNSLVQQLGLEGRLETEEMLAGLTQQLGIQARQAETGEIASAAAGGTEALSQLVAALKGATTTGQTASTQATEQATVSESAQELVTQSTEETAVTQETITKLSELVDSLLKTTGDVTSRQKGLDLGITG